MYTTQHCSSHLQYKFHVHSIINIIIYSINIYHLRRITSYIISCFINITCLQAIYANFCRGTCSLCILYPCCLLLIIVSSLCLISTEASNLFTGCPLNLLLLLALLVPFIDLTEGWKLNDTDYILTWWASSLIHGFRWM